MVVSRENLVAFKKPHNQHHKGPTALGATLSQPRTLKGKAPSAPHHAQVSKKSPYRERLYGFGGTKASTWGSATCPGRQTPSHQGIAALNRLVSGARASVRAAGTRLAILWRAHLN